MRFWLLLLSLAPSFTCRSKCLSALLWVMFLEHLCPFQLFKYLILSWDRVRYCSAGKHLSSRQHTLNSKRAFNLVEHKLRYSGCRSDVFSPQCPSGCSTPSPADLKCLDSYFLAVCNPLAKVMGVQQICVYIYLIFFVLYIGVPQRQLWQRLQVENRKIG